MVVCQGVQHVHKNVEENRDANEVRQPFWYLAHQLLVHGEYREGEGEWSHPELPQAMLVHTPGLRTEDPGQDSSGFIPTLQPK